MLKKYISESFFNPIIHVLPIVTFLLVEDFYGLEKAWIFSIPLVILLVGYVLVSYKSIFRWYMVSVSVYFFVGLIVSYTHFEEVPVPYNMVIGELVALLFMLFLLVFRKAIQKLVVSISNKKLSMENNMDELIRTTNTIAVIFAAFSLSYVLVYLFAREQKMLTLNFVYEAYTTLLVLVFLYETIRVFAVRGNLLKEEWLPIVNENGQEIGSINYQTSIGNEQKKFMHPVVRVIVIEGNRIFLRKNLCKDDINPDCWDNAICTHIKLKEGVAGCVKRAAAETYGISEINPVFLANYCIENSCERQFVHLFISCRFSDADLQPDAGSQVKWWTIQQINEELDSGIFTENFLKEYELLLRSGLIDSGRCQCDCKLRDEIEGKK
ncbi:MAG: hypothetical protein PHQ11_07310 [Paludibacter sp.]|nr:hypothetical protein [Paludibacter sp.]MDD4199541.1 hypothetical protein [Paludibacter sp.]MDD4427175.1 hypothetical protein [Paludibacter sp.]